MEPFFFNANSTQLFGIYHPASDPGTRQGAVICHPFGNETARTYQATRAIAQRWSKKAHVLRFDYCGTGDSFGDWAESGPERWITDIGCAVEELAAISGADKFTLAGIRLGGLLAAHAVSELDITKLLLWDPVLDGGQYREELDAAHQRLVESQIKLTASERAQSRSELCGFDIAPWMDSQLASLKMPSDMPETLKSVDVVQTTGQHGGDRLYDAWASTAAKVGCYSVDFDCAWSSDLEGLLNAPPVVGELEKCL